MHIPLHHFRFPPSTKNHSLIIYTLIIQSHQHTFNLQPFTCIPSFNLITCTFTLPLQKIHFITHASWQISHALMHIHLNHSHSFNPHAFPPRFPPHNHQKTTMPWVPIPDFQHSLLFSVKTHAFPPFNHMHFCHMHLPSPFQLST